MYLITDRNKNIVMHVLFVSRGFHFVFASVIKVLAMTLDPMDFYYCRFTMTSGRRLMSTTTIIALGERARRSV